MDSVVGYTKVWGHTQIGTCLSVLFSSVSHSPFNLVTSFQKSQVQVQYNMASLVLC